MTQAATTEADRIGDAEFWAIQNSGKVFVGDSLDYLRRMPDLSVDFVWADPPYNSQKPYGEHHDDDMPWVDYYQWADKWLTQAERIARRGVALLLPHRLLRWYWWRMGEKCSLIVVRKHTQGCIQNDWQRQYLGVLSTAKPVIGGMAGARCVDLVDNISLPGDGYFFKEVRPNHPAFTSEKLTRWAVDLLSAPGELVCDPFMGTMTTAVACERLGRQWCGCEGNAEYVYEGLERLRRAREKMRLPI